MTLDELHAWATNPRMDEKVDLCTLWRAVGEHWPIILAASPEPHLLRQLGEAIDACCGLATRGELDEPHPCCAIRRRLQPHWQAILRDDRRVAAILRRLADALNRFCREFSAASRSRGS